jgi:hypothetical protein
MKETLMYVKWNDMSIREKGLPSCGTSTIGLKILIFNGGFFNCSLSCHFYTLSTYMDMDMDMDIY